IAAVCSRSFRDALQRMARYKKLTCPEEIRVRTSGDEASVEFVYLQADELQPDVLVDYRRMMELCAAGRAGTPDEVGTVGALLMGPDGAFITGSDFLMDGGVTAAYWFGELAPKQDK